MNSLEIHMNERKMVLAEIARDAIDNELIDNAGIVKMYEDFAKQCEVYKYMGMKDPLIEALDDEAENDTFGNKAFLESFVDEGETITILQVIKSRL